MGSFNLYGQTLMAAKCLFKFHSLMEIQIISEGIQVVMIAFSVWRSTFRFQVKKWMSV